MCCILSLFSTVNYINKNKTGSFYALWNSTNPESPFFLKNKTATVMMLMDTIKQQKIIITMTPLDMPEEVTISETDCFSLATLIAVLKLAAGCKSIA